MLLEKHIERIVTFALADETYAVSIDPIESIMRWEPLTRLPRMPRFMAGIYNLRGRTIPVIDLRTRLGLPAENFGDKQRIVVANLNGLMFGLIVDGVKQVLTIPSDSIESDIALILHLEENSYLRGVIHLPTGLAILLDLEHVISKKERVRLQSLQVA
jgi:purine-binding chemotaxis protein CheW